METREIRLSPLEFQVRTDGVEEEEQNGEMTIKGHASVFNSLSEDLGGFREMVKPGAFRKALYELEDGEDDIRALAHHDTKQVLGRTANDTLQIQEDEVGLAVRIELPDTTVGRDTRESIKRGDLDKMSIGFNVREGGETWDFPDNGPAIRTLTDIELFEVSVVAFPAFRQTDVSMAQRSMAAAKGTEIPAEKAVPNESRVSVSTYERLSRQKQLELELDI